MDWKSIGSKILEYAPEIGSALINPVGAVSGLAIKALSDVLGVSEGDLTPEKAAALISADPEIALKAKIADNDFIIKKRDQEIKGLQVKLQDVASARTRETEIVRITGKKDINLYVLAWFVVAGFFVLVGLLCFHTLPLGSTSVVFMLFGALATGFGQVLQYFFGSSASSQAKTNLMAAGATAGK